MSMNRRQAMLAGLAYGLPPRRPDQHLPGGWQGSLPAPAQIYRARQITVIGAGDGVFIYDAAGNLRLADVGQTTPDPLQGITCYEGQTTFNGHGAVISLNATALGAQLYYLDTGGPAQGQLIGSWAVNGGTDPFGSAFLGNGPAVYSNDGTHFVATQLVTGLPSAVTGGISVFSATSAAGPYSLVGGGALVSAAGLSFGQSPILLATLTTDASGYPGVTDTAGMSGNLSICQPGSTNVTNATGTTFANMTQATIVANDAEVNTVYEIELGGYGTQAAGAAVNLTLQARFGASPGSASDVVGVPFVGFPAAAGDSFQWSAKLRAQCVSTGVSATWRLYLTGAFTDLTTGASVPFAVGTGQAPSLDITRDSTSAIQMGVSAKWASAAGAPVISKSGAQFGRRG